eukprot:CAMPEP_0197176210 /NCGR_PEP_ID=MMETSP1423-20130617/2213_1 /TAXON_ID=476441 /ORGANISM="Pseudo-nitzschia heimii, Strain UNC1101" /LENGTH=498 /DNA_ID=CAMNT_0042625549 /DNA_START=144 /DNA_END=1636 /DNA_ORIENTATION=-
MKIFSERTHWRELQPAPKLRDEDQFRGGLSAPLCGIYSKKRHALGRGIANHLRDVHTPWNPGKLAQKLHRRQHERRARESKQFKKILLPAEEKLTGNNTCGSKKREKILQSNSEELSTESEIFEPLVSWTPTEDEKKAWAAKIIEILRQIEGSAPNFTSKSVTSVREPKEVRLCPTSKDRYQKNHPQSLDNSGKLVTASYRNSLPPFLMAASDGDLVRLQEFVDVAKEKDAENTATIQNVGIEATRQKNYHLRTLLNTQDRHKSTAYHWAAGGGHLDCLQYLYNLSATLGPSESYDVIEGGNRSNKSRRRDGKTCLHYAARNGHVHCIRYLLKMGSSEQPSHENPSRHIAHRVDERSGDGTTPLHLACYGGHLDTVKDLVENHGADPRTANDWGCTCAHWTAMTLSDSTTNVRDLCVYLSEQCGVHFTEFQGQGHTALHKAAHRRNRHVIEWMADSKADGGAGLEPGVIEKAGAPDQGGHKPSDIWRTMGGDVTFADW